MLGSGMSEKVGPKYIVPRIVFSGKAKVSLSEKRDSFQVMPVTVIDGSFRENLLNLKTSLDQSPSAPIT